jgi:rubrerythrin
MKAWKGITAEGLPEAGTIYFPEAQSAEDIIALAWLLEAGSQKFYETLSKTLEDAAASKLFAELAQAESHHKGSLERLYVDRTKKSMEEVSELLLKASKGAEVLLEGGMRLDEALAWAEGRIVREILGLSISLEASAYDRYLYMLRRATDEGSRAVFQMLAGEEKRHLGRLGKLVESRL